MTLWREPLADVTFDDIQAFCEQQTAEGLQLDYKEQIPNDLAKTVAAFANTRGGLLLLGIAADKTTNKPKVPIQGMDGAVGLSERITQICRDGIHPGIIPEISSPITVPDSENKVVLALRVDESSESPHSISNGTQVYVRTGDTSKPLSLANVTTIVSLLERKGPAVDKRERLVERHLVRAR